MSNKRNPNGNGSIFFDASRNRWRAQIQWTDKSGNRHIKKFVGAKKNEVKNRLDEFTRLTKFVGASAHASIVLKGEINYVSGQYYEKFYNRNFIRLLDGENKLMVMGDIDSIEFEYAARRVM